MPKGLLIPMMMASAVALAAGGVLAQQRDEQRTRAPEAAQGPQASAPREASPVQARPQTRQTEPHPGPRGYQRPAAPAGWNARPTTVDRGVYQHNYQAPRHYNIGPYHPPRGWTNRGWTYGEFLPRAYWAPEYFLSDYWLFGLEVPPGGYEWIREGDDALLIDINTGQILQVEVGVFG